MGPSNFYPIESGITSQESCGIQTTRTEKTEYIYVYGTELHRDNKDGKGVLYGQC